MGREGEREREIGRDRERGRERENKIKIGKSIETKKID